MRQTVLRAFVAVAVMAGIAAGGATPPTARLREASIASVRLGVKGMYKLGCWTQLQVDVQAANDQPFAGAIEAITSDSDGVRTTVATSREQRVQVAAGKTDTAMLFIRSGQESAPLTVRLVNNDGQQVAARTFMPGREAGAEVIPSGLPATSKLVITVGAREDLAANLARDEANESNAEVIRTVRVDSVADLPTAWYGYEGVDAVILSGAQPGAYAPDNLIAPRIEALREWVELGGQLVIFCGATTPELLRDGGPLAALVPGHFTGEFVALPDFVSLETFSGAGIAITPGDDRLHIPKLTNVEGRVLAQGPADLPLVVRARRGLGEVTFVAVDPDAPPIGEWSERKSLLRQSLQWPAPPPDEAAARIYGGLATADLVNQLRSALDQQFVGVSTAPFALVAALVLLYVALIGPGDYFLLKRLGRVEWTWVTFPLAVIGTSAAAYALAFRMKGDELRVNQVEIVDVDVAAGQARGTIWTHFFNPRVQRYDLAVEPRFAGRALAPVARAQLRSAGRPPANSASPPPAARPLVAWLGVPGVGLGAMQGQHGPTSPFDRGYDFAEDLAALRGMPVEQWSTKTLTARWKGAVGRTLDAELRAVGEEQLSGRVTNRTGVRLEDCILMHGGWAYQLAPLDDGAVAVIDDALASRTIRTTLTSVTAGDDPGVRTAEDGSVVFDELSKDVARIVKIMMFYDVVGGAAYVRTPHRYQSFIDMSRLVAGDQAVLLARAPAAAGSQWTAGNAPLASASDRRWVYYRFVIPLENDEPQERPLIGPLPAR